MKAMTVDVPIDVRKMSLDIQGPGGVRCLQGWVNEAITGNPRGLHRENLDKVSDVAKAHLKFGPYDLYGDFVATDNQAKWPSRSEFAMGSEKIKHNMLTKNYKAVQKQLNSYKKVGVNFIPIGLPAEKVEA